MSISTPAQPIKSGHVNDAGVLYDASKKNRLDAEEMDHAKGMTDGRYSNNIHSSVVSGVENVTEDLDTKARGLIAEGAVGPLLATPGAGSRLFWYPGKRSFRVGTVSGDAWDDANIDVDTFGLGRDLEIGPGSAGSVVIGSGVDDTDRLVASSLDEILIGQKSDVPTVRVTPGSGAGTVGLTGIGLGATIPTALADIGASTVDRASMRWRLGVAPTVPLAGDVWFDGKFSFSDGSVTETLGPPNITTVTAAMSPYAVTATDEILLINPTAGSVIVTLPAATVSLGRELRIKRIVDATPANVVTVTDTPRMIDGELNQTLNYNDGFNLVSDGADWQILAEELPGRFPVDLSAGAFAIPITTTPGSVFGITAIGANPLTVPDPTSVRPDFWCWIKDETGTADASGNLINVDPFAAETFDGAANADIAIPFGAICLYTDGTNWLLVPRRLPPGFQATATGLTTTGSGGDVLIPGMTITPGAGTFLVSFQTTASHSEDEESIFFSVYVNGVQQAASEVEHFAKAKEDQAAVAIASYRVTAAAAQAIEIRWRRTAPGTASSLNARAMSLVEVQVAP